MGIEEKKLGVLLSEKMEGGGKACISDNLLSEFIENKLSGRERERVLEHLNSCPSCFDVYQMTVSIYREMKEKRQKKVRKNLSIAASVLIVFLIGFYYAGFYQEKTDHLPLQEKPVLKRKITAVNDEPSGKPAVKLAGSPQKDKEAVFREADKRGEKKNVHKKSAGKSENPAVRAADEVKRIEEMPKSGITAGIAPKEKRRLKSVPASLGKEREVSEERLCSTKVATGSNIKRDGHGVPVAERKRSGSKGRQRGQSGKLSGKIFPFHQLCRRGFVYRGEIRFGSLKPGQIAGLIVKWEKLLPDLRGDQRETALETIKYLKQRLKTDRKGTGG